MVSNGDDDDFSSQKYFKILLVVENIEKRKSFYQLKFSPESGLFQQRYLGNMIDLKTLFKMSKGWTSTQIFTD